MDAAVLARLDEIAGYPNGIPITALKGPGAAYDVDQLVTVGLVGVDGVGLSGRVSVSADGWEFLARERERERRARVAGHNLRTFKEAV